MKAAIIVLLVAIPFATAYYDNGEWKSFINQTPEIISWPLEKAYPGIEYNIRLGVIGGKYPYTFNLSQAPSGMEIDRTGEISWAPDAGLEGTSHQVMAEVTDSLGQSTVQAYTLNVTRQGFYFVSPTGDDATGNGSIGSPFRTINHSVQQGTMDDILYFRGGEYVGAIDTGNINKWVAYPGEEPVIDLALTTIGPDGNYGLVDGLEIRNASRWAFSFHGHDNWIIRRNHMHHLYDTSTAGNPSFMFFWDGTGSDEFVIQDNVFHDLFDRGSGINGDETANYHGGAYVMYDVSHSLTEDNEAYNIDGMGFRDKDDSYKNTIRGNHIHDVHNYAIGILNQYTAYNVEILYNIMGKGTIGLVVGWQPQVLTNISAHDNTIIGSIRHNSGTPVGDPDSLLFFNNIIHNIEGDNYPYICCNDVDGGVYCGEHLYRDYNLIYTDEDYIAGLGWGERFTLEEWNAIGFDINSVFSDPMFVDYENNDFTLQQGSPACGAGIMGEDIGAYPCESGFHPADNDPADGNISTREISAYISSWQRGGITIQDLLGGIRIWKGSQI